MNKVLIIWLLAINIFMNRAYSQEYNELRRYTISDGLPSNHIYDLVEDNHGFLWIATDNGVSRFDGKYFKNFSIKDGLPSHDAVEILKDGQGKIWVNCFQQNPVYFDECNNKFIKITAYSTHKSMREGVLFMHNAKEGKVEFSGLGGYWQFKNQQLFAHNIYPYKTVEGTNININLQYYKTDKKRLNFDVFFYTQAKGTFPTKSKSLKRLTHSLNSYKIDDERYFFNGNIINRISNFSIKHNTYSKDELFCEEQINEIKILEEDLHVKTISGNFYIYDRRTFKFKNKIISSKGSTNLVFDKQNNLWIGTFDEGLKLFGKEKIKNVDFSNTRIDQNFLSITSNEKGDVYAGNYYGQIINVKSKEVTDIGNGSRTKWIRKLLFLKNKVVVFSDGTATVKLKETKDYLFFNKNVKTAIILKDTVVILGTNDGLWKYNLLTNKTTKLNISKSSVNKIFKINDNIFYYTADNILYSYDFLRKRSQLVFTAQSFNEMKFQSIALAQDSSLWLSNVMGDVFMFKNLKLVLKIDKTLLPDNISSLFAHKNQIWVGSKTGVSIIQYNKKSKPVYSISNISKYEGLKANAVNSFCSYRDTVYAATENGIAMIPDNINVNSFKIRPIITRIKLFDKDTTLLKRFELPADKYLVTIDLAGIDLSGHFKNMQYALNSTKTWYDLSSNTLNLKLEEGEQKLFFRAVSNNNVVGNVLNDVSFKVSIPFYNRGIFWTFLGIISTALFFITLNRRKLSIQRRQFDQQLALEKQRNRITADLHDDIGASLSSLQMNSVVANQLVDRDVKKAKIVLEKIEWQSKNIADKIGDIIWSMKPGKDEFMSISSRIKNFANEILGSTNIDFEIHVQKEVDWQIKDITTRKNLVFITKEALNNAVKYSKASKIWISLEIINHKIVLKIEDNGIGFDAFEVRGNGVANMKKRTEEILGSFSINTAKNQGTSIGCIIPSVP